jgi:hypothetical protein
MSGGLRSPNDSRSNSAGGGRVKFSSIEQKFGAEPTLKSKGLLAEDFEVSVFNATVSAPRASEVFIHVGWVANPFVRTTSERELSHWWGIDDVCGTLCTHLDGSCFSGLIKVTKDLRCWEKLTSLHTDGAFYVNDHNPYDMTLRKWRQKQNLHDELLLAWWIAQKNCRQAYPRCQDFFKILGHCINALRQRRVAPTFSDSTR